MGGLNTADRSAAARNSAERGSRHSSLAGRGVHGSGRTSPSHPRPGADARVPETSVPDALTPWFASSGRFAYPSRAPAARPGTPSHRCQAPRDRSLFHRGTAVSRLETAAGRRESSWLGGWAGTPPAVPGSTNEFAIWRLLGASRDIAGRKVMARRTPESREKRISAHKHALGTIDSDEARNALAELTRAASAVDASEAAVAAARLGVQLARARIGPTLPVLVQSVAVVLGIAGKEMGYVLDEGPRGFANIEQQARTLIAILEGKGRVAEALRKKLLSTLQGLPDENLASARQALEEKREQLLLANLDLAAAIARAVKVVRMNTSSASPLRKLVVPSRPRSAKPRARPEAERIAAPAPASPLTQPTAELRQAEALKQAASGGSSEPPRSAGPVPNSMELGRTRFGVRLVASAGGAVRPTRRQLRRHSAPGARNCRGRPRQWPVRPQ